MGKQLLTNNQMSNCMKICSPVLSYADKQSGTANTHIFRNVHYQCNKKIPLPE